MKKINNQIKHWICFSNTDLDLVVFHFLEYLKVNDTLPTDKIYYLGMIAQKLKYYMSFIHEFIAFNKPEVFPQVLSFLKVLENYPNLCEFTANKSFETFENLDFNIKQQYIEDDKYKTSIFQKSRDVILENNDRNFNILIEKIKYYNKKEKEND